MSIDTTTAWIALVGLGAFHGINPGMGWLFAVALGMQEQRRSAVWKSLLPLALGHALAIGATILLVALAGQVIPVGVLKWIVAGILLSFAFFRLFRHGHPRYGGMQVAGRDLTVWSFLMASAHGAGLMVLPFIFGTGVLSQSPVAAHHPPDHGMVVHETGAGHGHLHRPEGAAQASEGGHAHHAAGVFDRIPSHPIAGMAATVAHTAGYLLFMGFIAVFVYEKLGLRLLQKTWINLDYIWLGALFLTALLTPFV